MIKSEDDLKCATLHHCRIHSHMKTDPDTAVEKGCQRGRAENADQDRRTARTVHEEGSGARPETGCLIVFQKTHVLHTSCSPAACRSPHMMPATGMGKWATRSLGG